MLTRRHQPGIRLKQQKGCEEQHSLNHQVCLFQNVSTKGFTPSAVLNLCKNLRNGSNFTD